MYINLFYLKYTLSMIREKAVQFIGKQIFNEVPLGSTDSIRYCSISLDATPNECRPFKNCPERVIHGTSIAVTLYKIYKIKHGS